MANFTSLNGISCDNVTSVNGVSKSSINNVDGLDACDSNPAMSRLVAGFDDKFVSYAPTANIPTTLTWENNAYASRGESDWDFRDIAYGKDDSGNPFYVGVRATDTQNIIFSTSTNFIDSAGTWTLCDTGQGPIMYTVLWGNNVWVVAGQLTGTFKIWRSTDGSTWSSVNISGLTGIDTAGATNIKALTSDGSGTWWFGVGTKIYKSTDNAASWSLEHTLDMGASGNGIKDLVFTNNSVICLYHYNDGSGTNQARVITAASSDTTDWGTATHLIYGSDSLHSSKTNRCAAGNGRVVFIDTHNSLAADVNGKTFTVLDSYNSVRTNGSANCIATDGEGNWWIGSDGETSGGSSGGDIFASSNNGITFAQGANGIKKSGNKKVEALAVDRYLPL